MSQRNKINLTRCCIILSKDYIKSLANNTLLDRISNFSGSLFLIIQKYKNSKTTFLSLLETHTSWDDFIQFLFINHYYEPTNITCQNPIQSSHYALITTLYSIFHFQWKFYFFCHFLLHLLSIVF